MLKLKIEDCKDCASTKQGSLTQTPVSRHSQTGPGVAEPTFLAQAMLGGLPNAGGLVRLCVGLTLLFTAFQAVNFRA